MKTARIGIACFPEHLTLKKWHGLCREPNLGVHLAIQGKGKTWMYVWKNYTRNPRRGNMAPTRFYVTQVKPVAPVMRVNDAINSGVFPGKMCSDHRKNHGCGQKKTEGLFGAGTAAKYCKLKQCADQVRSRTQERESPQRQISVRNLKFSTFKKCHSPPHLRVALGLPSPPESVRVGGRSYADVTTKIFRTDGLPNLLSNGAPL